jgi:hypothetical protein
MQQGGEVFDNVNQKLSRKYNNVKSKSEEAKQGKPELPINLFQQECHRMESK